MSNGRQYHRDLSDTTASGWSGEP